MAYKVAWLLPQRIIYLYMYDYLAVSDMEQMFDEAHALVTAEQQTEIPVLLHTIVDNRDVSASDVNLNDLRRIVLKQKGRNRQPGWSMTIAPQPMQRFFGSLAMQFMGVRGRQVATIEDAISFLVSVDESLPSAHELLQKYLDLYASFK